MSHKTVRRYQPEEIRGVMHPDPMAIWIQLEGPFVHADDYDTLRTQARGLAEVTLKDRAEACPFVEGSHGAQVWMASDTGAQVAKAVLDATKEGG